MSTPPGPEPYPREFGAAWEPRQQQPLPPSGTGQPQIGQAPEDGAPRYYQQQPYDGEPRYYQQAEYQPPQYYQPAPGQPRYHQPEPGYGQPPYDPRQSRYGQPQDRQPGPGYGQPPYDPPQPRYEQPQYYRQAPGNGQPPGPRRMARHQPPKPRRTGLIIGVCAATVAVLVALGAGFNAVKSSLGLTSPSPGASPAGSATAHTLTRPASAAGYTRLTGNVGRRLETEVRQQARRGAAKVSPAWATAFTRAQIGLYSQPGTDSRLIFFGFSARGTPTIASILRAQAPSAGLDSFFLGAGVASTHDFPAGLLGGVLRCGTTNQSQTRLTMCAWDDSSVLAAVAGAGISQRALARVTLAFRNAAEH